MKKAVLALAVALPFIIFYSCRHEPILPEYQVSYSTDIIPIINSSCMHSGCHNDTANAETHTFNTYEQITDHEYVVPGKPHDSKLYNAIVGAGEEIMPRPPYDPLNNAQIRKIYIWIAQGAKNN
jgi:hypothetical protein